MHMSPSWAGVELSGKYSLSHASFRGLAYLSLVLPVHALSQVSKREISAILSWPTPFPHSDKKRSLPGSFGGERRGLVCLGFFLVSLFFKKPFCVKTKF